MDVKTAAHIQCEWCKVYIVPPPRNNYPVCLDMQPNLGVSGMHNMGTSFKTRSFSFSMNSDKACFFPGFERSWNNAWTVSLKYVAQFSWCRSAIFSSYAARKANHWLAWSTEISPTARSRSNTSNLSFWLSLEPPIFFHRPTGITYTPSQNAEPSPRLQFVFSLSCSASALLGPP